MTERKPPKSFVALLLQQRLRDFVEGLQTFCNIEEDEALKKEVKDLIFVVNEFNEKLDDIIRKDYFVKTEVAEK